MAHQPAAAREILELKSELTPQLISCIQEAVGAERTKMLKTTRSVHETQKLRIPILKSRLVYGAADPTELLEYGECWFHLSDTQIDSLTLAVTRSPAYHPGDVRVLRRVSEFELLERIDNAFPESTERTRRRLAVLADIIVFPTKGIS